MEYRIYLFILLIVPIYCCKKGDIECKTKEILVLSELYKHYRELKSYQDLLIKTTNDAVNMEDKNPSMQIFSSPSKDKTINHLNNRVGLKNEITSYGNVYKGIEDQSTQYHSSQLMQITKATEELGVVLSAIRTLLLMILLSPDKIGSHELSLVLNAIEKPTNTIIRPKEIPEKKLASITTTLPRPILSTTHKIDKTPFPATQHGLSAKTQHIPFSTTGSIPFLATHGLFSVTQPMPFSTTQLMSFSTPPTVPFSTTPPVKQFSTTTKIPLSTTQTLLSTTLRLKRNNKTNGNKKGNKKNAHKNKDNAAHTRDAMKEYRDSMIEYNEVMAEYRMMQRMMYGYGRK